MSVGSSGGAAICVLMTLSLLGLATGCGQSSEQGKDTAEDAEVFFTILIPPRDEVRLSPQAARVFLAASRRSRAIWHGIPREPRPDLKPWAAFRVAGEPNWYYVELVVFFLDDGKEQWRWKPPFMIRMANLWLSDEYKAESDPERQTAMLLQCITADGAGGP